MKIYIKFLIKLFVKSIFYVLGVMASLVIILNLLTELDFFKEYNVYTYFPLLLTLLNSPTMILEMFPFIFLIGTQLFFINLFNNREIEIFKYSGLKNSKILIIISGLSLLLGIFIVTFFYHFSSNLKNIYLEIKSPYTSDGKYLAVITKNGLWIKDKIDNKTLIINSSQIKQNYLIDNFITEFDENFTAIRNIKSNKIDITNKNWIIYDSKIYYKNISEDQKEIKLKTNFNYKRIQSLYSNLSALDIFQLYELRKNYLKLNYSVTEVNLQLVKLFTFPIFLLLMTLFSASIMLRIKYLEGSIIKISLGLFCSVIIYYINNFFHVLGSTERIPLIISVFIPITILFLTIMILTKRINEK